MKSNKVRPDTETHALMFNISMAVGNIQEANVYLKKVSTNTPQNQLSQISTDHL